MDLSERSGTTFNHLPLDFFKIKHDLLNGNERRQLLILQALRWRLTRSESTEIRQRLLNSYIVGDLLNCRHEKLPNHIIDLIKNSSDNVRQYLLQDKGLRNQKFKSEDAKFDAAVELDDDGLAANALEKVARRLGGAGAYCDVGV